MESFRLIWRFQNVRKIEILQKSNENKINNLTLNKTINIFITKIILFNTF